MTRAVVESKRPGASGVLVWVPTVIAVGTATVAAVGVSVGRYGSVVAPRELVAFAHAGGDAVLAGHWDQLYADSFNQSGPLQAPLDALLLAAVHTGWLNWMSVAAAVALAWFASTAILTSMLVPGRSLRVRRWLPVAAVGATGRYTHNVGDHAQAHVHRR